MSSPTTGRIKPANCSLMDSVDISLIRSFSSSHLHICSHHNKISSMFLIALIIVSSSLCTRVEGRGVAALGKGGGCMHCPTGPPLEFKPVEHIGILITLGVIIIIYLGIIACKCYPVLKSCCCNKEKSSSAQNIALSPTTSNIQLMNQANRHHRSSHQYLHPSSRNGRSSRDNNNDTNFVSINMMGKIMQSEQQNQNQGGSGHRRESHQNGRKICGSRNSSVGTSTTLLDVEAAAAAETNSGIPSSNDVSTVNHDVNHHHRQQHLTSAPHSRRPSSNEVNTITGSMVGQQQQYQSQGCSLTTKEGSTSSDPKERRSSNTRLSISSPQAPSSRRASSASRKASNASVFINEGPASLVNHHDNIRV